MIYAEELLEEDELAGSIGMSLDEGVGVTFVGDGVTERGPGVTTSAGASGDCGTAVGTVGGKLGADGVPVEGLMASGEGVINSMPSIETMA